MMTGPEKAEGGSIHRPPIADHPTRLRLSEKSSKLTNRNGRWRLSVEARPTEAAAPTINSLSHYDPLVIPVDNSLNSYQSWHGYQVDAPMLKYVATLTSAFKMHCH